MKTDTIVEQAVNKTERATFAFPTKATRLEAVAPGDDPNRHSPRQRSFCVLINVFVASAILAGPNKARPTTKEAIGIMVNWHKTPSG